jgi:hypothetical protein
MTSRPSTEGWVPAPADAAHRQPRDPAALPSGGAAVWAAAETCTVPCHAGGDDRPDAGQLGQAGAAVVDHGLELLTEDLIFFSTAKRSASCSAASRRRVCQPRLESAPRRESPCVQGGDVLPSLPRCQLRQEAL